MTPGYRQAGELLASGQVGDRDPSSVAPYELAWQGS